MVKGWVNLNLQVRPLGLKFFKGFSILRQSAFSTLTTLATKFWTDLKIEKSKEMRKKPKNLQKNPFWNIFLNWILMYKNGLNKCRFTAAGLC